MTVVIGLPCSDGVILCADSQHTSQSWFKQDKPKIAHHFREQDSVILFAGSGPDMYIQNAIQDATADIDKLSSVEEIADCLQKNLLGFFGKRIAPWAYFPDSERPSIELLVAIGKGGDCGLYHYSGTAFVREHSPIVIGAGVLLGNSLVSRLGKFSTVDKTVPVAAYVLARVKEYVDSCGGFSSISVIRTNRKVSLVSQDSIEKMEEQFKKLDKEIDKKLTDKITKSSFHDMATFDYSMKFIKQLQPVDKDEQERWKELDKKRKPEDRSSMSSREE